MDGPAAIKFLAEQCDIILRQLHCLRGDIIALSAIAEGADTIFAEAALAQNIPLEIVLPFNQYAHDFDQRASQERFEKLYASARLIHRMPYAERSDSAYSYAMNWLVDHSDILIAAWDGSPSRGFGGTADAVKKAIMLNLPWIHINVIEMTIAFHAADSRLQLPADFNKCTRGNA